MKPVVILLTLGLLISCHSGNTPSESDSPEYDEGEHTNTHDPANHHPGKRKMKCGLYADSLGNVYFPMWDVISERSADQSWIEDSTGKRIPLNNLIDTLTFEGMDNYFRDKNHIYNFFPMSGGGTFYILDADPATFQHLGWGFGKDKDRVFCRGGWVETADAATFKVIPDEFQSGVFPGLALDKNIIYDGNEPYDPSYSGDLKDEKGLRKWLQARGRDLGN
ncbi:MAG: DKNYY domain-containing protein [Bacteroidia bacterium]|nr:DKNYY domain-containing protein [Bacteroidia bacterium]